MTRAAVIPYSQGACSVVVAADGLPAPVTHAESWPVGSVVPIEDAAPGAKRNARREVTSGDAWNAARAIVAAVSAHGSASVALDWTEATGAGGDAARRVGEAVEQLCACAGITVERFTGWRVSSRDAILAAVASGFTGWPDSAPYYVCAQAGALWLHAGGSAMPRRSTSRKGIASPLPAAPASGGLPSAEVEPAPTAQPREVSAEVARIQRSIADAVANRELPIVDDDGHYHGSHHGPRYAGIDPGSGHVALVVGLGDAPPLHLVHVQKFSVGEIVPLPKPRTVKRADGSTYEVTTRRSLTGPMVEACAADVVATLVRFGVTHLAIEHVDHAFFGRDSKGAAFGVMTQLIQTAWIEGQIRAGARAAGIEVAEVAATSWRAVVAGRAKGKTGGAGRELVPAAVRAGFDSWPVGGNDGGHLYDAGGILLWLIMRDAVKQKSKRAPRDPSAPKRRTTKPTREANRERHRRDAAAWKVKTGCTCPPGKRGRHPRDCPAFGAAPRPVASYRKGGPRDVRASLAVDPAVPAAESSSSTTEVGDTAGSLT